MPNGSPKLSGMRSPRGNRNSAAETAVSAICRTPLCRLQCTFSVLWVLYFIYNCFVGDFAVKMQWLCQAQRQLNGTTNPWHHIRFYVLWNRCTSPAMIKVILTLAIHRSPLNGLFNINKHIYHMMTSSNGNIFPRNWPFVRGIHRSRWIPHTKASDAELRCLLWSASE